jgi:hypothetical protein
VVALSRVLVVALKRVLVEAIKRVLVMSPSSEVGSVVDSDGGENPVSVAIRDGLFDHEGREELLLNSRLRESVNVKRTGHVKSYILMHKIGTPRAEGFKLCGAQLAQEETRKRRCDVLKAGLAVK